MKKQTRKYNTASGFLKAWAKYNTFQDHVRPFSFSDYLRGYWPIFSAKQYTQVYFELSEEAKAELFALFASGLCSTKASREKYAAGMAEYIGKDYGIFSRLWIRKAYGNRPGYVGEYCAGQDYTSETRTVQSLIRKGSLYF